jgi:hypothetical protein
MLIGPWALTTVGATTAALAIAAPPKNLRRVAVEEFLFWLISITLPWIDLFEQLLSGLIP